jgi:hypothetical protein
MSYHGAEQSPNEIGAHQMYVPHPFYKPLLFIKPTPFLIFRIDTINKIIPVVIVVAIHLQNESKLVKIPLLSGSLYIVELIYE